jgi:hypothetical protein
VACTGWTAVEWQGDVDALLRQHPGVAFRGQLEFASGDGFVDPAAGRADQLAGDSLLRLVQLADGAVGQRERALVAGVGQPDELELVQIGGLRDAGERSSDGRLDFTGAGRINS